MLTEASALPRSTPEAEGISVDAILGLLRAASAQGPGQELHSLMVLRHGKVVAEGWWKPYRPDLRHLLFSLSKSFTSSAIGIAIGERLLELDDPVTTYFPDATPASPSVNLVAMKVRHLLTMSTGQLTEPWPGADGRATRDWVKVFLNHPVEDPPGTVFRYNSIATFMLSAILQRLTGTTLTDYLKPRLFDPLGITEAAWDVNPDGIVVGGWGLSVTTESIAKFGQLYLQDGVWKGRRLLPEGWVAEATRAHIQNGPNPSPDWAAGYGFQFWRCRHDSYRADGAFGQLCVVVPAAAMVVAVTARVESIQDTLQLVWDHLLPTLEGEPFAEDTSAHDQLRSELSTLAVRGPIGEAMLPIEAEVTGRTYVADGGEISAMTWRFGADACELTMVADGAEHAVAAGRRSWRVGACAYDNGRGQPVAAWGAWTAPDTYTMCLQYLEEAASTLVSARFYGSRVTVQTTRRGRFVDPAGPSFAGEQAPGGFPV